MQIRINYIKMCAKAKELQDKWFPSFGDYYWLGDEYLCIPDACRILVDTTTLLSLQHDKGNNIWLPQPSQLQSLLGYENVSVNVLNKLIFIRNIYQHNFDVQDMSDCELWLAFYMFEHYSKVWIDDCWIYYYVVGSQTCKRCGRIQYIIWSVSDKVWEDFCHETGWNKNKTICLECFAELIGHINFMKLKNIDSFVSFDRLWDSV